MPENNAEKVLEAAKRVFVRYGFRRTTMADISKAAGMSRPALYLVYPSKEEILVSVMARVFAAMLHEIRSGLPRRTTPKEKLTFVFDSWTVRRFEMVQASPDAKDLLESSYEFAADVTNQGTADFIAVLTEILEPLVRKQTKVKLSSPHLAQILADAVTGFKASAKNTGELRKSISGLIEVTLASLDAPAGVVRQAGSKRK